MSLKTQIQQVLKDRSVLDYLSKRGHSPVGVIGAGRYKFLCPFNDHNESKPSFVVYTQAEYENWHCYGCNRGHNIINLVSFLDNISFRDALEKLSDGIVISPEDDIKYMLDRIKKESLQQFDPLKEISTTLLEASWQCLLFLRGVDFDPNETHIIDRYYAFLDEQIINTQFDMVESSIVHLPTMLSRRKSMFEKKEEEKKYKNEK